MNRLEIWEDQRKEEKILDSTSFGFNLSLSVSARIWFCIGLPDSIQIEPPRRGGVMTSWRSWTPSNDTSRPSVQTVLTWCHQRLCIYGLYGAIQMLLLLLFFFYPRV